MSISKIHLNPTRSTLNNGSVKQIKIADVNLYVGTFTGDGTNRATIPGIIGGNYPCLVRENSTGTMAICYVGDNGISAYKSSLPNQVFINGSDYSFIGLD